MSCDSGFPECMLVVVPKWALRCNSVDCRSAGRRWHERQKGSRKVNHLSPSTLIDDGHNKLKNVGVAPRDRHPKAFDSLADDVWLEATGKPTRQSHSSREPQEESEGTAMLDGGLWSSMINSKNAGTDWSIPARSLSCTAPRRRAKTSPTKRFHGLAQSAGKRSTTEPSTPTPTQEDSQLH